MPTELITVIDIAERFGISRFKVYSFARGGGGPEADFETIRNTKTQLFWRADTGYERWRVWLAAEGRRTALRGSRGPKPATLSKSLLHFSDHQCVNKVAGIDVSWRLWWRPVIGDEPTQWWFGTPTGWYVSDDMGRSWRATGEMMRPEGHYQAVPNNAHGTSWMQSVLNGALLLRRRLEQGVDAVS